MNNEQSDVQREVQCPSCRHAGWMKAHDTMHMGSEVLFQVAGRESSGHILVACPKCKSVARFDPISVLQSGGKITLEQRAAGCLPAVAAVIALTISTLGAIWRGA